MNQAVTVQSAIFALRNGTENDFNSVLLETIPGVEHRFEAVNNVNVDEGAAAAEPFAARVEYLQSINLVSIPPLLSRTQDWSSTHPAPQSES